MADITDIEADAFDEIVKSSDVPVVLEFWIRSCDFCRKFKPVYEQLPDMFGGRVRLLRMNMLKSIENLRLAEGMGVEQTPTTKVFCVGNEVGEIVGYRTLEEVVRDLNSIFESSEECSSYNSIFK